VINDAESSNGSDGDVIVNNGEDTGRGIIYENVEEESKGDAESEEQSMRSDPQNNKGKIEDSS
jgi:hypothetical protein